MGSTLPSDRAVRPTRGLQTGSGDEAAGLRFDTIAMLHGGIVVERNQYPGVRLWRLAADVERIRALLEEVSNMAPSSSRRENAPRQ